MRQRDLVFFLLVAFTLLAPSIFASTINAASCSQTDVSNAVNSAVDNDTVQIPPGTCTWTATLTVNKAITLQGQGVGSTIIQDGVQSGSLMAWTLVANKNSRLTGIEFRDGGRSSYFSGSTINVWGSDSDGRRMRVDHNKFDHVNSYPNIDAFKLYGVIDHNQFLYAPTRRAINVHHGNPNDVPASDNIWAAPANFGSDQFLFIEDNSFTYDPGTFYAHIDCFDGGRFVVRDNTFIRGWVECHGTDSTGRDRGGRAVEVYNNNFQSTPDLAYTVTNARSGTWIIHDNTFNGYTYGPQQGPGLMLNAYRNVQSQQPFGGADGTNPWDKNVAGGPFLSGTASNAGTWAVTVNGAGWATNQWKGYSIRKTSGSVSCSSVTRDNFIMPTVTAVCNGHGLSTRDPAPGDEDWFTMRGADQIEYGNEFRVTQVVDPNTFKFSLPWDMKPATPATGNIMIQKGNDFSYVVSNTADTINFAPGTLNATYDLSFAAGDTFQLWRVDESMDQPCNGQGSNLGGGFDPPLPPGWNNQVIEGCYEWNNTKEGGADVDFTSGYSVQVVEGEHYFNDVQAPGYTPYAYPHPLVTGAFVPPVNDTTPPSQVTGLTATAVSQNQINLAWNAASDNVGVAGYRIYRGGTQIAISATNSYPNTGLVASTTYSYTVAAYDAAGNNGTQSAGASATTQAPDITLPTVLITSPVGGTVSGTITISADANDNIGVSGVQFKVDGTSAGAEDTVPPYSISWASSGVANGTHAITAVARDASGNTATSSAVNVNVQNAGLTAGLVAAYSFDEGSGTTASDATGNGNTGTLNGATWTAGKYGNALSLDGVNDYVTTGNFNTGQINFTISGWAKGSGIFASQNPSGINTTQWIASIPNAVLFYTDKTGWLSGSIPFSASQWNHFAVTVSGTSTKIYVNAVLDVTGAAAFDTSSYKTPNSPLNVGYSAGTGAYFNGVIDEIRIYNRVLSGAEIQADMNTAIGGTGYSGIILRGRVTRTVGVACPSCTVNFTMNGVNAISTTALDGTFMTVLATTFAPGTYNSDIVITDGATVKNFKKRIVIV